MSDSIFLLGDDGELTEVSSNPYTAEAGLQKLLADHVDLLSGAQMLDYAASSRLPPLGGR
jgi:hypothetical protein